MIMCIQVSKDIDGISILSTLSWIGVDYKLVELGVHTKGRDNRELNIEPLKFDQIKDEKRE